MPKSPEKQVSILGSSYFQPITNLIEHWLKRPPHLSNAVQSGYYESGYAASVILLLVAMLESYIVRLRYVQRTKVPNSMRSALDVLLHLYPGLKHKSAITEVYVLRDAIFHNHLWEIEYSWSGAPTMVLHGAAKAPAFGDKKYNARVNPKTRRTKALKLSIVPTRVNRVDARRVFETVWKTLLFLESKDRFQCYVSDTHVRFRGETRLFGDLCSEL
jgi:hypothetical protein